MNQPETAEMREAYAPPPLGQSTSSLNWQTGIGAAVLLMALWIAFATWRIPSVAYAAAKGGALVPGICAVALAICGCWLIWEARNGGWRNVGAASSLSGAQITPWVWVSAGLLSNVLWIGQIGFVLSCALCYLLAVQGLRRASRDANPLGAKSLLQDVGLGCALSLLVMLMFTRVLGIRLPALTSTGWL